MLTFRFVFKGECMEYNYSRNVIDKPTCVIKNGGFDFLMKNSKARHRNCLPACIGGRQDQTFMWYNRGRLHRLDGPAYISGDYKKYFILGETYNKETFEVVTLSLSRGPSTK